MKMTVVMSKKEAQALMADAFKASVGSANLPVRSVEWSDYGKTVTFELDSVDPTEGETD